MKYFNKLTIIGSIVGAAIGFSYYYFIGCENGCRITSSPWNSTGYGILMGYLIFSMFTPDPKKKNPQNL